MRRSLPIVTVPLALVALFGASCGGGPDTGSGPTTTVHVAKPVGVHPSASAKLVCSDEAQEDMENTLGVKTSEPVTPTWTDDVYSCRYVYATGSVALSVKELSNKAETTAYFDGLASQLGNTGKVTGLGQGAFTTSNGSVVVRKDYKVLLVDISGLPGQFGVPPTSSADVAITMAQVIMGCWSGA